MVSDVLLFLCRLCSTVLRGSLFDGNAAGAGIQESVKQSLAASSRGAAVEFKLEDFKRDMCILCSAAALKMLLAVKSVQFRAFV